VEELECPPHLETTDSQRAHLRGGGSGGDGGGGEKGKHKKEREKEKRR
jgi:hypothetical protein